MDSGVLTFQSTLDVKLDLAHLDFISARPQRLATPARSSPKLGPNFDVTSLDVTIVFTDEI